MTPAQKKLARHALGLDSPGARGRSYRNRFFCGVTHHDWQDMVRAGYAKHNGGVGHESMFYLTEAGARAALNRGEKLDPEDFPGMHEAAR